MKSYTVIFTQYHTYEVEAEDEWEARDKARREFENDMYSSIANPYYDEVEVECSEENEEECNEEYTETEFDEDGCPIDCPSKELYPDCYCMNLIDE